MKIINCFVNLQQRKKPEPIYAEPSKVTNSASGSSTIANAQSTSGMHFDEYDGVTYRNYPIATDEEINSTQTRKSDSFKANTNNATDNSDVDNINRHSDTELLKDIELRHQNEADNRPNRKFHSKSFSLSENRIAASSNLFQQNRDLWEKRAELQSQQCLTSPRILSRNRIAPDLVMDLPFPVSKDGVGVHSSRESLDCESEDLTSAERFAAPNQCTLKKNERFSGETYEAAKKEVKLDTKPAEKPKAEVKPQELCVTTNSDTIKRNSIEKLKQAQLDDVLHIEEDPKELTAIDKSPIPARNTKKFVTQFADLHLTGGCLSAVDPNTSTHSVPAPPSNVPQPTLSSFKPQVKVKPQIMKKPLVLPPTTPEMTRRSQE